MNARRTRLKPITPARFGAAMFLAVLLFVVLHWLGLRDGLGVPMAVALAVLAAFAV